MKLLAILRDTSKYIFVKTQLTLWLTFRHLNHIILTVYNKERQRKIENKERRDFYFNLVNLSVKPTAHVVVHP